MSTSNETFLEQSRAYLLGTEQRLQQYDQSDLIARAERPSSAPAPGDGRRARSSKDRSPVRTMRTMRRD